MSTISNIPSITSDSKAPLASGNSETRYFKKAAIYFNGKQINIGRTLSEAVENINKKSKLTGIKAQIQELPGGREKLLLTSNKRNFEIRDPNKILEGYVKNNQVGQQKKHFIQIVGSNCLGKQMYITYLTNDPSSQEFKGLYLTERTKEQSQKSFCPQVVSQILLDNPVAIQDLFDEQDLGLNRLFARDHNMPLDEQLYLDDLFAEERHDPVALQEEVKLEDRVKVINNRTLRDRSSFWKKGEEIRYSDENDSNCFKKEETTPLNSKNIQPGIFRKAKEALLSTVNELAGKHAHHSSLARKIYAKTSDQAQLNAQSLVQVQTVKKDV